MFGMTAPISRVMRISRVTARRQPTRPAVISFSRSRPVPYPGRTPHIHFAVSGYGFQRLITQLYVAGEAGNEFDPVLLGVRDPAARARLIVALRPSPDAGAVGFAGTFDIVLSGSAG